MKLLETINANLLILLNWLMPKHRTNKRVLIYADLGIGDLVMFMPTISVLREYGFELTFYVTRTTCKDILKRHFPECSQEITGTYGWSLNNFHGTYHKWYFWKLLFLRIPRRVGHAWNKWAKFFNYPVHFELNGWRETEKNIELVYQFVPPEIPVVKEMFFEVDEVSLPCDDYLLIQPCSSTDPRKNIGLDKWIDIISCEDIMDIILIGNSIEGCQCRPIRNYFNSFVRIWIFDCLTIFEAAYVIKNATKFLCLESGLAHIASALGTPTEVYYKEISNPHAFHNNVKYIRI
jgi:ADP-heptose:LPS heptosyltransferase